MLLLACLFLLVLLILACLESADVWEDLLLALHMLVSKRMMHGLESAVRYRSTANNVLVLHCSSKFFVPCVVFQPVMLSCVVYQPVLLCHAILF